MSDVAAEPIAVVAGRDHPSPESPLKSTKFLLSQPRLSRLPPGLFLSPLLLTWGLYFNQMSSLISSIRSYLVVFLSRPIVAFNEMLLSY